MKILHLTDSHLTAKTPSSRQDVYSHAILRKFEDLTELIHQHDVDCVIHTGDVFHTPRISLDIAGKLAHIFLDWGVPIYVVPGNHDIDGYNLSTIHQTMLGFLARTGVIQLLTRRRSFDIPYDCPDGTRLYVHLEGQEYYDKIDTGNPMDYALLEPKDFNILGVHGMLMEKPYFPEVPHTLIEEVETDADVVLVGHYHPGFKPTFHNQTQFLNPGSLGRVDIAHREPFAYLLDIRHQGKRNPKLYLHDYQPISLPSAAVSDDIFDFNAHQEKKTKKQNLLQFKASVEEAMTLSQSCSMEQLLEELAKTANFSTQTITKAKEMMNQAKQENPSEINEIKGYHVSKTPIHLTKVEIKNFLSHKHTVIDLHPDLNVLIGETNSGKSAILRAILWCLYNEPKGIEFLRTGEKKVSVTCHFSNGYQIERTRTDSQSGYYEITDANGEKQRFSGFGNEVPIQIFDLHQMPAVFLAKDMAMKLNVNEQLEGPFLIAESPQRKAQMVGRLVGTQYIDHAIKQLNKEVLGHQRTLKVYLEQIKKWEKESEQYEDLPLLAEQLDYFESLVETQERLEQEIKQLTELKSEDERCQQNIQETMKRLAAFPDLSNFETLIEQAEGLIQHLEAGNQLIQRDQRLKQDKEGLTHQLATFPNLSNFDSFIEQGEQQVHELFQTIQCLQQLTKINEQREALEIKLKPFDTSSFESMSQSVSTLMDQIVQLEQLSTSLSETYQQTEQLTSHLDRLDRCQTENDEKINGLDTQLRALYQQQGICPTCGSDLNDHQIHYLMEH